jgi:putative PIN family toxin of toxin-antitoxin system
MPASLAVLDTMVIIGGMIGSKTGADYKVVKAASTGVFRLATSDAFFREVSRVLTYQVITDKLSQPVRIFEVTLALGMMGQIYYPQRFDWPTLRDMKDWWLLDLAYEAGADYLVTRDKKVLTAGRQLGFEVLTPPQFLEELEKSA